MNGSTTMFAVVLIALAGLITACASTNPHPMDMSGAIASAKTPADHMALAEHYEAAAQEDVAKALEMQKMLEKYKQHSYIYGKQAAALEEHCEALIDSYQRAANANRKLAETHRRLGGGAPSIPSDTSRI